MQMRIEDVDPVTRLSLRERSKESKRKLHRSHSKHYPCGRFSRDLGKYDVIDSGVRAPLSLPEVRGEICGLISSGTGSSSSIGLLMLGVSISLQCRLALLVPVSEKTIKEFGLLQCIMGHCLAKHQTDENDSEHLKFAGRTVHLITTKDGWEQKLAEAAKEGKIVVANFSATWCGPCKMIAPFYSDLSVEHRSLMFLLVDVDELTEFSTSWDIKATPTFFFLRDGQQVDKLVGANKPELQKKITAILDLLPQAKCRS
ncbi:hypothetical protein SAY87_031786 [Trapa incisa]|uniref:Thioredoxin domain-containing protein n=1 Tax=Trapa incisa TaxID=236973 RepID=A0AAN7KTY1_9MYRT|nr:hypothetical protein SAY87_031786 [Trapa incisa]